MPLCQDAGYLIPTGFASAFGGGPLKCKTPTSNPAASIETSPTTGQIFGWIRLLHALAFIRQVWTNLQAIPAQPPPSAKPSPAPLPLPLTLDLRKPMALENQFLDLSFPHPVGGELLTRREQWQ